MRGILRDLQFQSTKQKTQFFLIAEKSMFHFPEGNYC